VSEKKQPRKEWIKSLFEKFYVPFLFNKFTEILVYIMAVCLLIMGVCSCIKLPLGLNQNTSLVEGSDPGKFFDTMFRYGNAGPPAYLVFKNINYTEQVNLDIMSTL